MYKKLYAGIDSLDVAFAGALSIETLERLKEAKAQASDAGHAIPVSFGPGNFEADLKGSGTKSGYSYVLDSGLLGAIWLIKHNSGPSQWNFFVSVRATTLLAYGYEGTRDLLWADLKAMGAKISDHSVNRIDFAMDFRTLGFELDLDLFIAHARAGVMPYYAPKETIAGNEGSPSAVFRGRKLESVTIGKMPGKQVIFYNKRKEALIRQKDFWFEAWGVDKEDPELEVWRIELRAAKKVLYDSYKIRTFDELETGLGDIYANMLESIRYLAPDQADSNLSRHKNHPLWDMARDIVRQDLSAYRSGLTPGQILDITHEQAIRRAEANLLSALRTYMDIAEVSLAETVNWIDAHPLERFQ